MRTALLVAIASSIMLNGCSSKSGTPQVDDSKSRVAQRDKELLQGVWVATRVEHRDGVLNEKGTQNTGIIFEGDQITVFYKGSEGREAPAEPQSLSRREPRPPKLRHHVKDRPPNSWRIAPAMK